MSASLLALLLLTAAESEPRARFLISIGNNVGQSDEPSLRWAEEDAQRVHELFLDLGQIDSAQALLILGGDAQRARAAFQRVRDRVVAARTSRLRTELFVYYSGHGDAHQLHLGSSSLSRDELDALLGAVPADVKIAVVDSCRGRNLSIRPKGAVGAPEFQIELLRDAEPSGRVLISSASRDEVAQESDELQGSFFTHHMVSGLRGAADADNDGLVSLAELYRYSYNRTLATSHGQNAALQHPEMMVDLEGEGEVIMTRLHSGGAEILLPAELEGNVLIIHDRSQRVFAEVRKARGSARSIALPSGRFRVQLRKQGHVLAGEIGLEWGGRWTMTESALEELPWEAVLAKGTGLDPEPWTLELGGFAARPWTLESQLAIGGQGRLQRRLGGSALHALASLEVSHAAGSGVRWNLSHWEWTAGLGVGADWLLGPLRISTDAAVGAVLILERAVRIDAARVAAIGLEPSAIGSSLGPELTMDVSVLAPIGNSLSVFLRGELAASWLAVDSARALRLRPGLGLGVAIEL